MKILKIIFVIILSTALIGEIAILISGKTFLNKVFAMTAFSGKLSPDIDEMDLFDKREIKTASPQVWPVSSNYGKLKADTDLLNKCEEYKTVAFLVIKNDSLTYEKYWENYGKDSYSNSFSMAKSFTAALIGVALKEGKIKTSAARKILMRVVSSAIKPNQLMPYSLP
jgi:CubicO group peptidase (beta-lactamase class C family)